jgi:hypothetical protein
VKSPAKLVWACSAAVVAGLVALSIPAVASIVTSVAPIVHTAETALSAETPDATPASTGTARVEVVPGYTAEELETAKAMEPQRDINHPSRWAEGCTQNSHVSKTRITGAPVLVDMGPREFATGEVTRNDQGLLTSYTVAPGDAMQAIGHRFCMDEVRLLIANDAWPTLQPGDVLSFPTIPTNP